jgi:hypothetical protein
MAQRPSKTYKTAKSKERLPGPMPIFSIEQREQWHTLVTYSVEADTQEEAQELTRTATHKYDTLEILNRDCVKVLDIHETQIH